MDASATSAWVAAGIALAALPFNVSASRSARRQTELQSQIHRDSAQPYVWADIRGDEVTGQLVKLIVCNEGPTVATDVKVHFTPPLVSVGLPNDFEAIQGKLGSGFPSLPPGRRLIWNLAFGMKLFDESVNVPLRYHVAITGRGPLRPSAQARVHTRPGRHARHGRGTAGITARRRDGDRQARETDRHRRLSPEDGPAARAVTAAAARTR